MDDDGLDNAVSLAEEAVLGTGMDEIRVRALFDLIKEGIEAVRNDLDEQRRRAMIFQRQALSVHDREGGALDVERAVIVELLEQYRSVATHDLDGAYPHLTHMIDIVKARLSGDGTEENA